MAQDKRETVSELLGARTDTLDRVSESLRTDARRVQDIQHLAQRAVAELQASWSGPDLMHLSRQWEQQTSPQLDVASASLETCAATLRAQSTAQRMASGDGVSGLSSAGLLLAAVVVGLSTPHLSPPDRGSPQDNATWWSSLGPQQRQRVITQHPDWIGNRDGVAFSSRDQANRALLSVRRADLESERKRLEADLAGTFSGGLLTASDAALKHVRDKLASIEVIEQTLARPGERQLVLLEMSQQRAQTAIARGNLDTADHVAVFVPGLTTNVTDSLKEADAQMGRLQHRAELESSRVTPLQSAHTDRTATASAATATNTTATVTWIGYQVPQWKESFGLNSVAHDQAARNGAAQLVPFLQGISSARPRDAHLTVLGHSYGSTTAGLALQQTTGVDDAVFFGSPGLHTDRLEDLRVPAGHTYYIEAPLDGAGDFGAFGIDPSHLAGIEHASARESTVTDPMTGKTERYGGVMGHTSYLTDKSTSQYNMAVVVAGVPERRVHDRGVGAGDVLSWPLPGAGRTIR